MADIGDFFYDITRVHECRTVVNRRQNHNSVTLIIWKRGYFGNTGNIQSSKTHLILTESVYERYTTSHTPTSPAGVERYSAQVKCLKPVVPNDQKTLVYTLPSESSVSESSNCRSVGWHCIVMGTAEISYFLFITFYRVVGGGWEGYGPLKHIMHYSSEVFVLKLHFNVSI